MSRETVLVVGPGRVGLSLALELAGGGERAVLLAGRSDDAPSDLPESGRIRYVLPGEAVPAIAGPGRGGARDGSGIAAFRVIFAVPDDELAEAAEEWAGRLERQGLPAPPAESPPRAPPQPPAVALHTSGVHPPGILAPLARRCGMAVASWHPLAVVFRPAPGALRGVGFVGAGDEAALAAAGELTRELGGSLWRLRPGEQARYHAAAVFASNYLAACLAVAADEMARALEPSVVVGPEGHRADPGGSPEKIDEASRALRLLLPLARSALAGIEASGLPGGVTGPLVRGDAGTVTRHLEALAPGRAALYRALGRELLRVVEGKLEAPVARELGERLRAAPGDPGSG